ncbi:hypothetical protein C823_007769 [Eubacterium plexicaudatum ASF492]|uniref:Uncharacterized protein n=1 Tax=Eubacterium plexicaudatum ASF492 TaxID=1235802 RepID=N1ZYY6_9FIRM|nr:hypothetical protein C823_007769 [Eubacterium plexicaudatum ASF492]
MPENNSFMRKIKGNRMTEQKILHDIEFLIGSWFSALEDEDCNPWENEVCMDMANKYEYTREDYQKYCRLVYYRRWIIF